MEWRPSVGKRGVTLRSVDLIVAEPRFGAGEAIIEGSTASVEGVLTELARGRSVDEVAALYAAADRRAERPVSPEGVRAALAYGAALAREETLRAPAAAGFAERLPAGVSLEEVKAQAVPLLERLAAGLSVEEVLERERGVSHELLQAILRYGASLARHDTLALRRETADERFLRDLLTEHDARLVQDYYAYRRETKGLGMPEYAFDVWARLVTEVEGGYDDIYYEYANDLYSRETLEQWLSLISPTSTERWMELIAPLDRRFESATRPIERPIHWPEGKPRKWWWYRVPRRMGSATEEQFRRMGFYDEQQEL